MLNITVGAAPPKIIGDKPDLREEISMVKAALLYADKVKLVSIGADALVNAHNRKISDPIERIEYLIQITPYVIKDKYEAERLLGMLMLGYEVLKKPSYSPTDAFRKMRAKQEMQKITESTLASIERDVVSMGGEPLLEAHDLGLLEVTGFSAIHNGGAVFEPLTEIRAEQAYKEFRDGIEASLIAGNTFPLLDSRTASLVSNDIAQLDPTESTRKKLRHTGLVLQLFEKLPLFDNASIGELVDIKKELSSPLARFRAGVIKFSEQIKSEVWDRDFTNEVNDIIYKDVYPTISDIEQAIRDNKYLLELNKKFSDKGTLISGASSLGVGVLGGELGLDALVQPVLASLLGMMALSNIAVGAASEYQSKKSEIEKNQLYFYYKAGQLMSN